MDIGTLVVLLVAVTIIITLVWTWTSISREQNRQRRFAKTSHLSSRNLSDEINDDILLPFLFSTKDDTNHHSAAVHYTASNVHHDTMSTPTTHSSHSHDGGGWLSSVADAFDGGSSDGGGWDD